MSNVVPDGWNASNMAELCKFTGGGAFKEKYQGNNSGDYPFIKVSDMNLVGNERYITKSRNWITEVVRSEAKVKLFPSGSVVFAKVGAALLLNRRRILTLDTAIDNNMMAAMPFSNDNNFLYYLLQDIDLGEIVQSGVVPSVNQSQMEDIPITYPPLPEQQRIATILSSVDDVIEKTQAQIDKLKDLKTGMMQELLTKGIGHTEFKDSSVERIPVGWEVKKFGDLTIEHKQGFYSKEKYTSDGTYLIRITDMQNPYISFTKMPKVVINDKDKEAYKVINGDFLFARSGAIGRYGIYDSASEAVFASYLIRFRFDLNETLNEFIGFWYESDVCQKQLGTITQGSSNININAQNIKELKFPVPPINEQKNITQAIMSVVNKINVGKRKAINLQNTKKALMQDLLTGKVRVSVS